MEGERCGSSAVQFHHTGQHTSFRAQRYQVCSVQQNLRSLATSVPREGATGLNVVAA